MDEILFRGKDVETMDGLRLSDGISEALSFHYNRLRCFSYTEKNIVYRLS